MRKHPLTFLAPLGLLLVLALVLVGVFFVDQDRARRSAEVVEFASGEVSFSYPESWKLLSDIRDGDLRSIGVESWDGALCIIQIDEVTGADETLIDLANAFAAVSEIDEGMVKSGRSSFSDLGLGEDGYERVVEECAVLAAGVRVPLRRSYFRKRIGAGSVTFIFQSQVPVRPGLQRGLNLIMGTVEVDGLRG